MRAPLNFLYMVTEGMKAMAWALNGEHLKVTPIVQTNSAYKAKIKGKTVTLNKVKLQIEIGNGLHLGTGEYKQDKEMSDKIEEIYLYYYNQRSV